MLTVSGVTVVKDCRDMMAFSYIIVLTVFLCDIMRTLEPTDQSAHDSTGICPPCVCYLRNQCLTVDCSNRSLTNIPNTLPMSTCILNLSMNAISTVNSHDLEYFPNLTVLDLSKNAIDDLSDDPFRSLQNVQYLNLTGNNMTYLNEYTFTNLTSLLELNVSNCQLSKIHPESLSLHRLHTLDLSENQELEFDGLENATFGLQESNITKLLINRIVSGHRICVRVTTQNLKYLQNTSLETIEANGNQIESFEDDALNILPDTLKYVSVRNNRFAYANYINTIPKLKGLIELELGGHTNSLHDLIPLVPVVSRSQSCYKSRKCGVTVHNIKQKPHDEMLFSLMKTINMPPLPIPPNLKRVKCRYAEYSFAIPEINFTENKLEYIDMSYNVVGRWKGPMYGLHSLKYLDLSQNFAAYVSYDFFTYLQSLTFLNLSGNSLGRSLANDHEGQVFKNLYNVKTLDLSRHYVRHLPPKIFQGLRALVTLNISFNDLFSIHLNLSYNKNLTLLDCSYNHILSIDPHDRLQLDLPARSHNFSLDLRDNPLHCHCDEIEFWEWVTTTRVNLLNIYFHTCRLKLNVTTNITSSIQVFQLLTAACGKLNTSVLFLGVLPLSVIIISAILGSLSYRYRWKLRYWYYAAKIRMKASSQPSDNFDFDAFVSYADEDRGIVIGSLMSKIEAEGLHLNIHHRDFIPGNAIAENIIDAIQRSRKTIIILSKNFLKSKWCQYELHMANMESVSTGREIMLIVMLEDIPTRLIPPEILYHIQTNTYIDYPHSGDDDDMFWSHLCQSLRQ